jgi:hypothetical protein
MLSSFKQMMPLLKDIHDGYKFFMMNFIINIHKKKLMRMEANMVKKIVFSKLWEHDAYYKVRSVCF